MTELQKRELLVHIEAAFSQECSLTVRLNARNRVVLLTEDRGTYKVYAHINVDGTFSGWDD